MTIDWLSFTPWLSLIGGVLIGLAASLFIVANGRIAGISGMIGSLLQRRRTGAIENVLFLAGLLVAPLIWSIYASVPTTEFSSGLPGPIVAGLAVGGWRRHALWLWLHKWPRRLWSRQALASLDRSHCVFHVQRSSYGVCLTSPFGKLNMNKLTAFLAGILFGLGLLLAGMANPQKVLAFLDVSGAWDPSLALVMAGAIAVAIGPMAWARQHSRSLLGNPMQLPMKHSLDRRLIGGSVLFGIGWGITGICPGPAVTILLTGHWQIIVFMLAMLGGMLLFTVLEARRRR